MSNDSKMYENYQLILKTIFSRLSTWCWGKRGTLYKYSTHKGKMFKKQTLVFPVKKIKEIFDL